MSTTRTTSGATRASASPSAGAHSQEDPTGRYPQWMIRTGIAALVLLLLALGWWMMQQRVEPLRSDAPRVTYEVDGSGSGEMRYDEWDSPKREQVSFPATRTVRLNETTGVELTAKGEGELTCRVLTGDTVLTESTGTGSVSCRTPE